MTAQAARNSETAAFSDMQLLLRETTHRCSNDLQLVVAMLALLARRATQAETKMVLEEAAERVSILAHSRASALSSEKQGLASTLRHVCEALNAQAAPRSILIMLEVDQGCDRLHETIVAPVSLAVNELATNALKHAFREDASGHIQVIARTEGNRILITVEDDGLPMDQKEAAGGGLGFGLIRRLIASCGGTFQPPEPGSKRFVLSVPIQRVTSNVNGVRLSGPN
jgi:two-component sensor histidine kinase